jgi:hypothetical protein
MRNPESPEFEAIVDAVVKRLQTGAVGRIPAPVSEGAPERPQPLPWDPVDDGPLQGLPRRKLQIAGMELTQSIQHHGAVGESFGVDNIVPLVALKSMVVRVYPYVRPGMAWPDALIGESVTGELVLSVGHQVVYRTGPTRPDGVRVGPLGELSRTLWDEEKIIGVLPVSGGLGLGIKRRSCSLNFRVPAYYCRRGRMDVAVRIWRVGAGAVPGAQDSASVAQYVNFRDVRAPRIQLVRVNWDNQIGTVTGPTDAEMLRTVRVAERMFPFPYFEATISCIEQTRSGAFGDPRSLPGCNIHWKYLLAALRRLRTWNSLCLTADILVGMLPAAAIPLSHPKLLFRVAQWGSNDIQAGCGDGDTGVAACFVDPYPPPNLWAGTVFAHELGHIYGRRHVGVPGDSSSDPDYPNYGGRRKSIGEVGIDTGAAERASTLYDPAESDDIMSYGSAQWISPYTYQKIFDERHKYDSGPADPGRVRPVLMLEVRVRRTDRGLTGVELKQSFRIEAPGFVRRNLEGATSPLSIDLLDASRSVVATHHCFYAQPQPGCSCGCGAQNRVPLEREPYIDLLEVIEWPGEHVTALSFHRGDEPFAIIEAGEPPRVEIEGPERRQDTLLVRVHAAHPRVTPGIAVLFSGDDGVTWQPVGFDPPDGELSVEASRLPGGERCRFRAIAGAELQSAIADTEPFELAPCTRRLHVVTPSGECGIPPGPVALSALIDTRGRGAVAPHEIRWTSSLQGEIGAGYDLIADLIEGEHALAVSIPDGIGGMLTERAIIIVGGRPEGTERIK